MSPGCPSLIIKGPIISEWNAPLLTWLNGGFALLLILQGSFPIPLNGRLRPHQAAAWFTWIEFHSQEITTYTESPPFEARIELHLQGLGNLGDNVTGAGGALLVLTDSVMSPMGMVYFPLPPRCKHKVTSLHFKCLWNKSVVVHIVIHSAAMCVGLCTDLLGFWDESLVSPSPCPLDRQNHET